MNSQERDYQSPDYWLKMRLRARTRYFRVHVEQDLWCGWTITQVNGRSGSRLGRERATASASIEAALLNLAAIAKRRRQRDYALMS